MRLFVVTTEKRFEGETEAIHLLFENGLDVLHIRKLFASRNETKSFIEQITPAFHSRIVLHDHYDLAVKFNLKGIHLNNRNDEARKNTGLLHDVRNDEARKNELKIDLSQMQTADSLSCKRMLSISRSCHSLEDVQSTQFYDYVFLSPIFDSISKVGYMQSFTPQQLVDAKEQHIINEKVIALGGITAANITVARRYGFGGVAVLGALWSDFVADGDISELLKRFNTLKLRV